MYLYMNIFMNNKFISLELGVKVILMSTCTPHNPCGLFNFTPPFPCKMNPSPWQEGWDLTGM